MHVGSSFLYQKVVGKIKGEIWGIHLSRLKDSSTIITILNNNNNLTRIKNDNQEHSTKKGATNIMWKNPPNGGKKP